MSLFCHLIMHKKNIGFQRSLINMVHSRQKIFDTKMRFSNTVFLSKQNNWSFYHGSAQVAAYHVMIIYSWMTTADSVLNLSLSL